MKRHTVSLVMVKNTQGAWVVRSVYAKQHTARARASEIRNQENKEAFVLRRTIRGA